MKRGAVPRHPAAKGHRRAARPRSGHRLVPRGPPTTATAWRCWNWRRPTNWAWASRPTPAQAKSWREQADPETRSRRKESRCPQRPARRSSSFKALRRRAADAAAIAELCGSAPPEQIGAHAWRLRGAQRRERVAAWCDARRLDHAWVPEGRRFADLKLLAMDMDSTLITIECIDEIGEFLDLKDRNLRHHRAGDARRDRLSRKACASASPCSPGLSEDVLQDVYDEKLRLSPGAETLRRRLQDSTASSSCSSPAASPSSPSA